MNLDYELDDAWEEDEQDFYESECHQQSDGSCGLAGSEWCEFECPFRR